MHTRESKRRRGSRGVALVIALIVLLIVTLLATSGMTTSITEFVMAGNEQFHRKAADAASAGVEVAIAQLASQGVNAGASSSSLPNVVGETVAGDYIASTRFVGEEANLPGFSAEKFAALHFEIESTGEAARSAADEQFQGVLLLTSRGSAQTFVQKESGLSGGGSR